MKKKYLSLLSLVMAGMLVLSACGGGAAASEEKPAEETTEEAADGEETADAELEEGMVDTSEFKKEGPYTIGFSNVSVVNTWRMQMVRELEAAEAKDVELLVTDADGDTAKQVSDIQDLIAKGVDALLVAPGSTTVTNSVTKKALDQGIPVIVFNSEVDDESAFTRKSIFIESENWKQLLAL